MIIPLLTYSSIVTFNLNATQTARVQNLQDRATRTIKSGESAHLKVPDLMNLAKFHTCLLVKQCMDMNTCSNFKKQRFLAKIILHANIGCYKMSDTRSLLKSGSKKQSIFLV